MGITQGVNVVLQGWRMRFSKISVKNMNDYVK